MGENLTRIAFISDYLPRKCGIAVFATDLCEAMAGENPEVFCTVVAMNDTPEGYAYPPRVSFQITQNRIDEYQSAAEYLNVIDIQAVCVQHEFGIFGGPAGANLLGLLRELRVPIVSTLHTVLTTPTDDQRRVFDELVRLSDRLVVMSGKAIEFLKAIYGVPEEKIVFIHHGVPDVPFEDPNFYKDLFSVEGRKVVLTFGLIGPTKGIENVIEAMPRVVRKHPDAAYIVLGATHPHLLRKKGDEYRFFLQSLVLKRGLEENVIFHDRFVTDDELRTFIGAADVCVTPYPNEAQIASGTLARYVGYGKAVVSTPYWYAQELLDEGRGRIVPFRSPEAVAEAITDLFDNDVERHAMRKRAYTFGRQMVWREVARRYVETLAGIREERGRSPRKPFHLGAVPQRFIKEVPAPNFEHLERMTDETGILRHAKYTVPDRSRGYSTADNARALEVSVRAVAVLGEQAKGLRRLAPVYLAFLDHALIEGGGRFHGRMDYGRNWVDGGPDEVGSEESHGLALCGAGAAAAYAQEPGVVDLATNVFLAALPAARSLESPRAIAHALVGIHEYLRRFGGDAEARRVREELGNRIYEMFSRAAAEDWPWFEDSLLDHNASFPQGLILAGQWMNRPEMVETGLKGLEFLMRVQKATPGSESAHFSPVGDRGGYPRGGVKASFDQRPAEAAATMCACIEAWHVTRDRKWLAEARMCYEWFLGRNDLGISLYDHASGGCRDALQPDRANQNEGAEATLAWLLSSVAMEEITAEESGLREPQSSPNGPSNDAAAAGGAQGGG